MSSLRIWFPTSLSSMAMERSTAARNIVLPSVTTAQSGPGCDYLPLSFSNLTIYQQIHILHRSRIRDIPACGCLGELPCFDRNQQGTPYNSSILGGGGIQPYTFSVGPGTLPSNLTIDANTGAITGTPTANGPVNLHGERRRRKRTASGTASTSCTLQSVPQVGRWVLRARRVRLKLESPILPRSLLPVERHRTRTRSFPVCASFAAALDPSTARSRDAYDGGSNPFNRPGDRFHFWHAPCDHESVQHYVAPLRAWRLRFKTSPAGQSFTSTGRHSRPRRFSTGFPGSSHTIATNLSARFGRHAIRVQHWSMPVRSRTP